MTTDAVDLKEGFITVTTARPPEPLPEGNRWPSVGGWSPQVEDIETRAPLDKVGQGMELDTAQRFDQQTVRDLAMPLVNSSSDPSRS